MGCDVLQGRFGGRQEGVPIVVPEGETCGSVDVLSAERTRVKYEGARPRSNASEVGFSMDDHGRRLHSCALEAFSEITARRARRSSRDRRRASYADRSSRRGAVVVFEWKSR
jgi:hypothetical protein